LNTMQEFDGLAELVCFFCKTGPESHDITIDSDSIYYLTEATCEYYLPTKEDGPNQRKKTDLVPANLQSLLLVQVPAFLM
jgi:hypothetical protein